jgi:geranylgeranyl pyrophosphate synthase
MFMRFEEKKEIGRQLEKLFPKKVSIEWIEKNLGKATWEYDEQAINEALTKPIWELLARGGKRWRPKLMLLCCEAVGGKKENAAGFAVIPELIHNGTLMVDDVEDASELRRGKPAIHKIFGEAIAVNAGNTMYYLPLAVIKNSELDAETKNRLYEAVNEEMLRIGFGQATDIYWSKHNKQVTEEQYMQMCANKTGALARMAAKIGAVLGSASSKQVKALEKFAEAIGVAFQIQDDVLNISSKSWGKDFGEDITEGKKSLVVVHAMNAAVPDDKKRLKEILCTHTQNKHVIDEAIGIINKYGSVKYAREKAKELVSSAWKEADAVLKESAAKKELRNLTNFLIERSH